MDILSDVQWLFLASYISSQIKNSQVLVGCSKCKIGFTIGSFANRFSCLKSSSNNDSVIKNCKLPSTEFGNHSKCIECDEGCLINNRQTKCLNVETIKWGGVQSLVNR